MNKEQLKKEIFDRVKALAEKVKQLEQQGSIKSEEGNELLNKSVILYERLVLYNYLDGIAAVIPTAEKPKVEESKMDAPEPVKALDISVATAEAVERTEAVSVSERLKSKPIESIRATIGINERFRFANDLFEGSMHELNAALSQLDTITDMEDALRYMDSLNNIYKWKSDLPAYVEFLGLIRRKFTQPTK